MTAIGWPIAHIANTGPLAVAVNVVLVVALGSVAWRARPVGRVRQASGGRSGRSGDRNDRQFGS